MSHATPEPNGSMGTSAAVKTPGERLRDLAAAVRRRWVAAAAVMAVTLVATAALTAAQHKTYNATAQILLQPPDTVQSTISPGSVPSQADAERDVTTYTQMITVDPVAQAVRRQLDLKITLPRLVERVTVSGAETSNLVNIAARDGNPARAAQLASAFATQYQSYRRELALQQINSALAAAEANPASKTPGTAIAQRVIQLQAAAASETGGVQIIRPATVPVSPASPTLRGRLLLGLIVGAILALAAVLGLEAADRRLLTAEQIEDALQAPVFATLRHSRSAVDAQAARQRACSELASRLAFTDLGQHSRVIMISPVGSTDSAGTFALGLAEALGTLRKRVMLIEADLGCRPELRAGAAEEPGGLTAVLTGRSTLGRELTEIHFVPEATSRKPELEPWDVVSYSTLPSGPRVIEPEALLGQDAMGHVLEQAREREDIVLVLTGPLERPSSVLPLARHCDAAIAITGERALTRDGAGEVVELFRASGARLLGAVVVSRQFSSHDSALAGNRFLAPAPQSEREERGRGEGGRVHRLATAGTHEERS